MHHALLTAPLVVGKKNFEKQSHEIQTAILRAAEDAQRWQYEIHSYRVPLVLEEMKKEGLKVYKMENEEKMISLAKSSWPKLYDRCGGEEWVKQISKAMENIRR